MLMTGRLSDCFSETGHVRRRVEAGLHPIDEVRRFRAFACCLFCGVCVSLIYAFDLFTAQFKDAFKLTSGDLSTISTVGLVFCYFTIPYSFLYEYSGPLPLFAIAVVTGATGALLLALTFEGKIPGNTATISVFYAMLNTCSGLFDSASIVTLCELFPRNRGPIVGLVKVATGLGSSVLSAISTNFFHDNIAGFIYFIMALAIVGGSLSMLLVTLPPYFVNGWRRRGKTAEQVAELASLERLYNEKPVPMRRLGTGFIVAGALLVFFTVTAPITAYYGTSHGASTAIGVIAVVLPTCFWLTAAPFSFLGGVDEPAPSQLGSELRLSFVVGKHIEAPVGEALERVRDPLSSDDTPLVDSLVPEAASQVVAPPDAPQDPRYPGTVWENLRRPDIWLILLAFTCRGALSTIVMYNGTTISVALTGKDRDSATGALYTAFLGVGSACGRIAMGLFEAYVQHQDPGNRRLLVTVALPVGPAIETIAGILILVLPPRAILFPYLIIYFGEGIFASVCALIFTCLYERDHGVYYNMSFLTTVAAVILFNRVLFGVFIDHKYASLGLDHNDANAECNVRECVVVPIAVATGLTAFGTILITLIHLRYSQFVRRTRAAMKGGERPLDQPVSETADQRDQYLIDESRESPQQPAPADLEPAAAANDEPVELRNGATGESLV